MNFKKSACISCIHQIVCLIPLTSDLFPPSAVLWRNRKGKQWLWCCRTLSFSDNLSKETTKTPICVEPLQKKKVNLVEDDTYEKVFSIDCLRDALARRFGKIEFRKLRCIPPITQYGRRKPQTSNSSFLFSLCIEVLLKYGDGS